MDPSSQSPGDDRAPIQPLIQASIRPFALLAPPGMRSIIWIASMAIAGLTAGPRLHVAEAQPGPSLLSKSTAAVGTTDPGLTHMGLRMQGSAGLSQRAWGFSVDGALEVVRDQEAWRLKTGIRELRLDLYGRRVEARIGWQTPDIGRIAEGVLSESFTRIDLRDFTLPEREDLVLGTPMIRATWFADEDYLDLLLTPAPIPSPLPAEGSRWDLLAGAAPFSIDRTAKAPAWSADQIQAVFRMALRSPRRLNMDIIAGRWAGAVPAFGLEVTRMDGLPGAGDSGDAGNAGPVRLEVVESFPARWLAGMSLEWRLGGPWMIAHEHLLVMNQRLIESPVEAERIRASLADPIATQMLLNALAPRADHYLSPMPASSHQVSVTRASGRWSLGAGLRTDLLHGNTDRRFQRARFTTMDASASGRFLQDRLRTGVDAMWHLSPFDAWLHPWVDWEMSDTSKMGIGVQWFGGDPPGDPLYPHLTFHRFRNDGFAYLRYTRHII